MQYKKTNKVQFFKITRDICQLLRDFCFSAKLSQEMQRLHSVKALARDSASAFRQSSRKRFSFFSSAKITQQIRIKQIHKSLKSNCAAGKKPNLLREL